MTDLITMFINTLVKDQYDDINHISKYFDIEKMQLIVNIELFSSISTQLTEKQKDYILSCLNMKLIDSDTKYVLDSQSDEYFVEKSLKLLNDYHRINRFITNTYITNNTDILGKTILDFIWNIFASYSMDMEVCYCDKRIDIDEKYQILYKYNYPESFLCLSDCCLMDNTNIIRTTYNYN